MKFRDLHRQYQSMQDEMDKALRQSVASGNYIMGESVDELEELLSAYVGVRHCITCANGTDALLMSLLALGIGEGDVVFVPDFTFFATAEVVGRVGATPVFVDVDEATFNIDVSDLDRKITSVREDGRLHPAGVIAVDLFGLPADYGSLLPLLDREGIPLIEDAAQGFGSSLDGKKSCGFGLISATSFFPAKPLGCYGDGGALFTDNDDLAAIVRSLRQHGKGTDKYDNVRLGLNSRLDALQAAVLKVKLRHLDDELSAVRRIAAKYDELLCDKVATPVAPDMASSSWAQYTIRCRNRDELRRHLAEKDIPTAIYYPRTMSQQTAFASINQPPCPVAASHTRTVLSLPMHPYLTDQEIEAVASAVPRGQKPY